jgi:hypothetical protein
MRARGVLALFAAAAAIATGCGSFGEASDPHDGGTAQPEGGGGADASNTAESGAANAYRDAVLSDKPLVYYRLDDDGTAHPGGILYEEVAKRYEGKLGGNTPPTFAQPGAAGRAVHFAGGAWIELPAQLLMSAPFTVELWARIDDPRFSHVLTDQVRAPMDMKTGWAMLVEGGGFSFERYLNGQSAHTTQAATPRATGLTHVAAVSDGMTVTVFADGVGRASFTDTRALVSHAAPLVIAAAGTNGEVSLVGTVDEVALYDHALTAASIARHIAAAGP